MLLPALCIVAMQSPQAAPAPHPRGIVLVMADDLGWGDLGCYGEDAVRTPHLDAMASNGLLFERSYAAAPVCSPTRGSVLTGRHPSRYGIRGANSGHLPADELVLPELLAERGWATGFFGKWHLGTLTTELVESNRGGPRGAAHYSPPWEHGFERVFATEAKVPTWDPMWKPGTTEAYGTHYWSGPGELVEGNLAGDDSRVIVDRVLPFLRESVAAGRPFLAVVWLHAPHEPVVAGPSQAAPYEERAQYLGVVSAIDTELGRIRAELRALGVADDTLLWFTSDNGPEHRNGPGSTGGLRGRKRDLYEGGVRVPALLEWPAAVEAGSRSALPAVTSDVLPTLLARLSIETAPELLLDGVDLWPRLASGERGAGIGFHSNNRAAWIQDEWKLVRPNASADWELYQLTRDAAESNDLAASERARAQSMRAAWEAWRSSCRESAARLERD